MTDLVPTAALLSEDEHTRLQAARQLTSNPSQEALPALKTALSRERVLWIRNALQDAIGACQALESGEGREPDRATHDEPLDASQAYADGRRDGLRQALHELSPLLGFARMAAESELEDDSALRAHLEQMRAVLAALRKLISATAVPERRDFDLAALLRRFAQSPPVACQPGVVGVNGPSPFFVEGDPDLLDLAVAPVVANALEAVLAVHESPRPRSVMISWGAERMDWWIAVIDYGPGPPANQDVFVAGATNKRNHFGLGLETTRTAMTSLRGRADLATNSHGGATVLLRWPRAL